MASAANGTVIGFSLTGATLPAGSGTLVSLSYTATAENSTLSLGNYGAITDGNGNSYATVNFGADLTHGPADCAGTFGGSLVDDACGVCGGDGSDDQGCGCFEAGPSGCDNTCGSTATLDSCGTCDSDGTNNCVTISVSSSSTTGATVSYDSEYALGGFQFSVSGVTLTNADSDLSETTFNAFYRWFIASGQWNTCDIKF